MNYIITVDYKQSSQARLYKTVTLPRPTIEDLIKAGADIVLGRQDTVTIDAVSDALWNALNNARYLEL